MISRSKESIIQLLNDVKCSDGNCIFKIFTEQQTGQHTNGGCHCLDGLTHEKRRLIRILFSVVKELNVEESKNS